MMDAPRNSNVSSSSSANSTGNSASGNASVSNTANPSNTSSTSAGNSNNPVINNPPVIFQNGNFVCTLVNGVETYTSKVPYMSYIDPATNLPRDT